jgi:hypothetical protein
MQNIMKCPVYILRQQNCSFWIHWKLILKMCPKITASRYVAPCNLLDNYDCFEAITASVFKVVLILLSIFLNKLLCMYNDYTYL